MVAPNVTGVSPSAFWLNGNVFVQLTGTGFTGALTVKFGTVDAQWFFVVSDTQINCSPAPVLAAQTTNVRVVTPGGTSPATDSNRFAFVTNPVPNIQVKRVQTGSSGYGQIALADRTYKTWPVTAYGHVWIIDDQGGSPDVDVLLITNGNISGITLGPGGNAWPAGDVQTAGLWTPFTWKVTPAGVITQYSLPLTGAGVVQAQVLDICTGGNGLLWAIGYGQDGAGTILTSILWQITDAGVVTAFALPTLPIVALALCIGPNPNQLWIAGLNFLAVINVSAPGTVLNIYTIPGFWFEVQLGSDRNLWLSNTSGGGVLRFNPTTTVSTSVSLPGATATNSLCVGPDGDIWTVDLSGNLYRIDSGDLSVTTVSLPGTTGSPVNGGNPTGICVREDGRLCAAIYVYPGGGVDGFVLDIGVAAIATIPPDVPAPAAPDRICRTNAGKRGFTWSPATDCPTPTV